MSQFLSIVVDGVAKGLPLEEAEHAARVALYGYDTQAEEGAGNA